MICTLSLQHPLGPDVTTILRLELVAAQLTETCYEMYRHRASSKLRSSSCKRGCGDMPRGQDGKTDFCLWWLRSHVLFCSDGMFSRCSHHISFSFRSARGASRMCRFMSVQRMPGEGENRAGGGGGKTSRGDPPREKQFPTPLTSVHIATPLFHFSFLGPLKIPRSSLR